MVQNKLYLLNCVLFNAFVADKTLYQTQNAKNKKFLHKIERVWFNEEHTATKFTSDSLSGDFNKHKLKEIVACSKGKKKYPARQLEFVLLTRSVAR
jgi:tmRNA-binding protein